MKNWALNERALLAIIRALTFILSEMRKYWYISFGVELVLITLCAVRSYNIEVKVGAWKILKRNSDPRE